MFNIRFFYGEAKQCHVGDIVTAPETQKTFSFLPNCGRDSSVSSVKYLTTTILVASVVILLDISIFMWEHCI